MKSIYFFIPEYPNLYDDGVVYLGEGLNELGYNLFSNRNYWKTSPQSDKFLFNFNPDISFKECDIVVVACSWAKDVDMISYQYISQNLPKDLFDSNRKYLTVYIDKFDNYRTLSFDKIFRNFDIILKNKYNKKTFLPSNCTPWVLGFQNRILQERTGILIENKQYSIAVNFNYSHPYQHQLRKLAEQYIINRFPKDMIDRTISPKEQPNDEFGLLMWKSTFGLHNRKYYNHIEKNLMVAAFCGEMIPGLPFNPSKYMVGGNKAKIKKHFYTMLSTLLGKKQRIIQWDSWRFWETLALGSVPIHIDLEKYGVSLPIMPENWKHYIGIDLNNIDYAIERITEDKEGIYKIAKQGHQWGMENYSPKASAQRFINLTK
ncbi:hypothetical protein [Pedobacter sp.]|uniref:hypothetical protein n=1 Tax=Pedobacter sp. TaxID=1411316 RepID=UPI00396CEFC8